MIVSIENREMALVSITFVLLQKNAPWGSFLKQFFELEWKWRHQWKICNNFFAKSAESKLELMSRVVITEPRKRRS